MAVKLYVGGLSYSTTSEALREHFVQCGTVESATVITDRYSGQSRGFGFVEMATQEEAQKAVSMLNGQRLDGRTVKVELANPQGAGGGGGGGGGRGGPGMGGGGDGEDLAGLRAGSDRVPVFDRPGPSRTGLGRCRRPATRTQPCRPQRRPTCLDGF